MPTENQNAKPTHYWAWLVKGSTYVFAGKKFESGAKPLLVSAKEKAHLEKHAIIRHAVQSGDESDVLTVSQFKFKAATPEEIKGNKKSQRDAMDELAAMQGSYNEPESYAGADKAAPTYGSGTPAADDDGGESDAGEGDNAGEGEGDEGDGDGEEAAPRRAQSRQGARKRR